MILFVRCVYVVVSFHIMACACNSVCLKGFPSHVANITYGARDGSQKTVIDNPEERGHMVPLVGAAVDASVCDKSLVECLQIVQQG